MAYSKEVDFLIDLEAKSLRIKFSGGLVSSEAFLLGLWMAIFFQSPLFVILCVSMLLFPSYGDTSHIGPQHMALIHFDYLFKGLISKYSPILR